MVYWEIELWFYGKVQILAPESVKERYRQMIAKAENHGTIGNRTILRGDTKDGQSGNLE